MQIEGLSTIIVITGSSFENSRNLDPAWFDHVLSRYRGTRLERQKGFAEILTDMPGALRTRKLLDPCRLNCEMPQATEPTLSVEEHSRFAAVGVWPLKA